MFTSHGSAAPTFGRGMRVVLAMPLRPKVGATRGQLGPNPCEFSYVENMVNGVEWHTSCVRSLMIQIRPAGRAAGVPHGHVLAAFALDVVADHARAQQAAAGAAAGRGDAFRRIVEHVRIARRLMRLMMLRCLAALDRFALQNRRSSRLAVSASGTWTITWPSQCGQRPFLPAYLSLTLKTCPWGHST